MMHNCVTPKLWALKWGSSLHLPSIKDGERNLCVCVGETLDGSGRASSVHILDHKATLSWDSWHSVCVPLPEALKGKFKWLLGWKDATTLWKTVNSLHCNPVFTKASTNTKVRVHQEQKSILAVKCAKGTAGTPDGADFQEWNVKKNIIFFKEIKRLARYNKEAENINQLPISFT